MANHPKIIRQTSAILHGRRAIASPKVFSDGMRGPAKHRASTGDDEDMRSHMFSSVASAVAMVFLLAGCGGGGTGVASTPTPLPAVTPSPTPTQSAVASSPLKTAGDLATLGFVVRSDLDAPAGASSAQVGARAAVRFSYSAERGDYSVELPGFMPGDLIAAGKVGRFEVTQGRGNAERQNLAVFLDSAAAAPLEYTYTSYAFFIGTEPGGSGRFNTRGFFAYGVPTGPNEVPRAGNATYNAQIFGEPGSLANSIGGQARLAFDFGAGTLTGHMDPILVDNTGFGEDVALGRFAFADTNFASGSTTFTGRFLVPGSAAGGAFSGRFTGPGASELMSVFETPYLLPGTDRWGEMRGIWIGKRGQ